MLEEAESAKLPRELKGGQDGIFAGQGDQGRTGQGTVGVDPGAGVAQGVFLSRGDAFVAPASNKTRRQTDQVASLVKKLIEMCVCVSPPAAIYPAWLAQFYLKGTFCSCETQTCY